MKPIADSGARRTIFCHPSILTRLVAVVGSVIIKDWNSCGYCGRITPICGNCSSNGTRIPQYLSSLTVTPSMTTTFASGWKMKGKSRKTVNSDGKCYSKKVMICR